MKSCVIALWDSATRSYKTPVHAPAIGAVTREISDVVNEAEKKGDLAKHPEDFELHHMGSFDDSNGKFELFEEPKLIVRIKDLVRSIN